MILRAATPADLADIIALEKESPLAAHWSESQYSQALNGDAPRRLILVAANGEARPESEKAVSGFVVVRIVQQEWEIENIVVGADQQRRGIATELLHEVRRLARSEGASRLMLEVRASNVAARSLYEKIGFESCGYRRRYYSAPCEDAAVYAYVLQQVAGKS